MGHQRHAAKCVECGRVYSADVRDGTRLLPTDTGTCHCGATRVLDLTTEEVVEIHVSMPDADAGPDPESDANVGPDAKAESDVNVRGSEEE